MNDSYILPRRGRYTASELRNLIQSGRFLDLESVLPGLENSNAMALRWCYEEMATLEEMEPEDRRRLGELRLQSVDDVGSKLAARLLEVTESVTFASALAGESLARSLVLAGQVSKLETALAESELERAQDRALFFKLLEGLHSVEVIDRLLKSQEEEKNVTDK